MKTLRLVLGDQLNQQHSWFTQTDNDILYVMMEMRQETDYVTHHIQKVVGFFHAMRNFRSEQEANGHHFIYLSLDDPQNKQSLTENLHYIIREKGIEKLEYQLPDEYRLDEQLAEFCQTLDIPWKAVDTEHFLTKRSNLAQFFEGKKTYLMESFYRMMRKKYDILMQGKEPEGGQWNYDKENRKRLPKNLTIPKRNSRTSDVSVLTRMIQSAGVKTIGRIDEKNFRWPSTRREALADLEIFVSRFLSNFGHYQDAMDTRTSFGFHSLISFALNVKLLHPLEVIHKVIEAWEEGSDEIPIAAVEGYIRQVLGWREFMRGVYWAHMPEYASKNQLNHQRKLPKWYWDAKTRMNCMHQAIDQSLEEAYAHHIQRLMVTGNFALLSMIDPSEVDQWYLGIYIDAIEWVEMTNTRGMSQFADGGVVGTKPYVSSSNYIKKMSNYCDTCHYSQSKKTGENACPFNSLYWNFYHHHRDQLEKNPRIGMMYRTWDRMDKEKQEELLKQAEYYLAHLDTL